MGPAPAGANNWSCKPTRAHPRPVVLVHGTAVGMAESFSTLSPAIAKAGFCVFAFNYGAKTPGASPDNQVWGVADIQQSARELRSFVDKVLAETGAKKVDIVGHSQGGMLPRIYLKQLGGADPSNPERNRVRSLIGIGSTNHGTTFGGQQTLVNAAQRIGLNPLVDVVFPAAAKQQLTDSQLLHDLNRGQETLPGIRYTVIASRTDGVITPPDRSFLNPIGGDVRNIWVQDACPRSTTNHMGLLRDPQVTWLVLDALDPAVSPGNRPPCGK